MIIKRLAFIGIIATLVIYQPALCQDANKYHGGSYSGYDMATSAPNIALPVELTSFTTSAGNGHVFLQWFTESESGNVGFNIFRSLSDANGYRKINQSIIKGYGDSFTHRQYSYEDRDVRNGVTYYYKLQQVDAQGHSTFFGSVSATPLADHQLSVPIEYALAPNFPNPFNPETTIEYQLPEPAHITIKIFNLNGQEITILADEKKQAGYFAVRWDGRDRNGREIANGVYIYTLEAYTNNQPNFLYTRKMLLLR